MFDPLHRILLAKLNAANRIDRSRAAVDGRHIDAEPGAGTVRSPVNRGKPGSKHHLICYGNGTPMLVLISGANVSDISRAIDLLDLSPTDRRPPQAGPDDASTRCWLTRATTAFRRQNHPTTGDQV